MMYLHTLPWQRDLFAAKLAKVKSMDKWTQNSKHFSDEKKAHLATLGDDYDKCIQATKDVFIELNKDAANRQVSKLASGSWRHVGESCATPTCRQPVRCTATRRAPRTRATSPL